MPEEDSEIEIAEQVDESAQSEGDDAKNSPVAESGDEQSEPGNMVYPILIMAGFFLLAQILAVAASPRYIDEGAQAFGEDDTDSVSNSFLYIVFLLVFSAGVLFLAKKNAEKVIQAIFLGAMTVTIWYVLYPLLTAIASDTAAALTAFVVASIIITVLYFYPEWYVVDLSGILASAGVTAILGISFGPLPVLVLLIALAVYDAIAVYRTKHMIDLADSVTDLRLPVLLVVPKRLPYSYLRQKGLKEQLDSGEEREAMYMGLGDIVIPGALAVSAAAFLTPDRVGDGEFLGFAGNYAVAFFTILGGLAGFGALMYFVLKGRPQAGLPLLNSGAILGYAISAWLIFGDLGLKLEW